MRITIDIPDNVVTQYRDWFLAAVPNTERDENGTLIYTDLQWLKENIRRFLLQQCKNGEKLLHSRQYSSAVNSGDII